MGGDDQVGWFDTLSLSAIAHLISISYQQRNIHNAFRCACAHAHTQTFRGWVGDNFMALVWDSSPIRLHYDAICLQHRCHSREWMDICHAAGPFSLIAPVSPRGLGVRTLYMPTNTDLSPLSDLQTWPLSHTRSLLWWWQKGSVTQSGFLSPSGWMEKVVIGESGHVSAWRRGSEMNETDAGFMARALKRDHWRMARLP